MRPISVRLVILATFNGRTMVAHCYHTARCSWCSVDSRGARGSYGSVQLDTDHDRRSQLLDCPILACTILPCAPCAHLTGEASASPATHVARHHTSQLLSRMQPFLPWPLPPSLSFPCFSTSAVLASLVLILVIISSVFGPFSWMCLGNPSSSI